MNSWTGTRLGLAVALAAASGCGDEVGSDGPGGGSTADGEATTGSTGLDGSGSDSSGSDSSGGVSLDFSGFDAAVQAYLDRAGLEGATAAVVHHELGIVHTQAYGDFELDRIILLASASKTLSVGVLIRLDDEGILDLDAPLSSYVGGWDGSRDFSLAQMVSNSSGLIGLIEDPGYPPYLCQYLTAGTLEECAGTIHGAEDADTVVPPDTQFRYGGGQWQLAGGVAELVTGQTWNELVAQTYADTCGVALDYGNQFEQAFFQGGGLDGAFSYPDFFQGDPGNLLPTDNPNVEGGGYTTAPDYAELLLMQLRGGECSNGTRVLSPEGVARMQEDRILEAYGGSTGVAEGLEGYGLGWWVDRGKPGVVSDPGAYGSVPWLDAERGYAAVILLEGSAEDSAIRVSAQSELEVVFDGLP